MICQSVSAVAAPGHSTLKSEMQMLHKRFHVDFVYDASLNVDQPYKGASLKNMSLDKALQNLFHSTGISYKQKAHYIILTREVPPGVRTTEKTKAAPAPPSVSFHRRYTVSGYVRDAAGETLVNATIWDATSKVGTITNEYGYFSITLPEGVHLLRYSYLGFADRIEKLKLQADRHQDIVLNENNSLPEVTVNGDLNSPLLNTQTGKRSYSQHDIKTEFSLFSSPDVVKTLQRASGVTEGLELASGLYVHGGNSDENLFLIDGTPLYQTNHSMGLFSSFNADMVKNVDFYKSGFPARYGGRLSSVVDVRTNDGDFFHSHGSVRIGLMDGSLHFEGPLSKGRTSYNIGLRRSWLDLITRPIFWLYNRNHKDEQMQLSYFFHDLNAKVTHRLNDRSQLSLSLYSGIDKLDMHNKYTDDFTNTYDKEDSKENIIWGNLNAALNWSCQFSPQLFANFTAVYTHNVAKFRNYEDDRSYTDDDQLSSVSHMVRSYRSVINDIGYRTAFDFRPVPRHHLRFGTDYTFHIFKPQTFNTLTFTGDGVHLDSIHSNSGNRHSSHEWTLYAEDEMRLSESWSVDAGLNVTLFNIGSKTFSALDPRCALKYQASPNVSLKASLTSMTQYVHKISNSYLDLPTDYWVPTTKRLHPMRSWQLAAGIYTQPSARFFLSVEGYYKRNRHLLQYSSWIGLEPPADKWDQVVIEGKGLYYGLEVDADYKTRRIALSGSYTLSWTKRYFKDFYPEWYYDKFDNRHKVNLSARWIISGKVSAFAAWSFHTGNRITVPTQYIATPTLPSVYPNSQPRWNYSYIWENTKVFERPNNYKLPAYHRLDLGFDFHHTSKNGHEHIWNLSLYNVYCHLNSLWVDVSDPQNGPVRLHNHAYLPILPSFSYTMKF